MISVILPIYNVAPYLEKCLDSILNNTYKDLEVICVNDGSTDNCPAILWKMQKQDPRIIIVDQENQGLVGARNSGLEVAHGEYTAFIDPDDYIHPRYFQSMLDCMEKTNADVVICNCIKFEENDEVTADPAVKIRFKKLSAEEFYKSYYARHMVWGRLLRRRDTETLRFPKEVYACQDTLYNLRLISRLKNPIVYESDIPLYYYLQRSNSLAHSKAHPYDTIIEIAEWYLENQRDPHHRTTGDWSWTLLLQSVTMTLSCRYEAYLRNNRPLIKHTNHMLRIMYADILRDGYIRPKYKITRLPMILFPWLYRLFRLHDDPTMKEYEKEVKEELWPITGTESAPMP